MTTIEVLDSKWSEITGEIHMSLVPYHLGLRILHNVKEYLDGSNPAAAGRLSWVATWWKE